MHMSYAKVDLATAMQPIIQDLQMRMGLLNTVYYNGKVWRSEILPRNDSRIDSCPILPVGLSTDPAAILSIPDKSTSLCQL